MQIHTTARHCELDPELREFVQLRLEKLQRFARDLHEAHLIVTAEKFRHVAEITLRVNRHEIVSREEADEPRVAIDLAADHLEKQLRKLKEKRTDRHRSGPTAPDRAQQLNGAAAAAGAAETAEGDLDAFAEAEVDPDVEE